MEPAFDFKITSQLPLSKICRTIKTDTFSKLCDYIKKLPYGRTKNRSNYTSIIKEQKGTCSSKHAFLKAVAEENNQTHIKLYIGIYKMNEANTKGVGRIIAQRDIKYIPEAHTYLKVNNKIVDVTRSCKSQITFENSLLIEQEIKPDQIGEYKVSWHQSYIKQWLSEKKTRYSFKEIWCIREDCIAALSA